MLRTVMYNKLCYLCFLYCNVNVHPQNHFSFSIRVEQLSWNIGFSVTLAENLKKKLGLFLIVQQEKPQKISLTVIESQNLPNLQNLDVDSQIPHFEWTLHNGRRKNYIGNRSDNKK